MTTTNKIALLVALVVYVSFALTVSMVVPRFRPGFPGARGVRLFVVLSLVLFAGMVASVVAFAHEKPGPPRASTAPANSSATTASTSTTAAPSTSTSTSQTSPGTAAHGQQLAASLGCSSCHSLDGSSGVGPTWKGLAGSQVTLTDGSTVSADSAYLLRAIRDPDAQIVKGFKAGVMSSVIRPGSVSVQDAQDLVAFIQQRR
ncbi:MAG: c-type cytochrome [Gaiellaceae bacterium]